MYLKAISLCDMVLWSNLCICDYLGKVVFLIVTWLYVVLAMLLNLSFFLRFLVRFNFLGPCQYK